MTGATAADRTKDIFAANRARGSIALEVGVTAGASRATRVHEDGSLRVRFPGGRTRELDAVLVNTAGGVTGGDRFSLDVAVGEGAQLTVSTAAAEKVYRALDDAAQVDVKLNVGPHASLAWLPQETILFDQSRLARTIEVDVDADARLMLAEALVFGRTGMGERVERGALTDRWRIRREGRLVYAETVRLDGQIAEKLALPAIGKGAAAVATVILVPGDDAIPEIVRAFESDFRGEVGASAWNGGAVIRFVAGDGAAMRHDLMRVLTALRDKALPRLWLQ
jgi:urease accessory protein